MWRWLVIVALCIACFFAGRLTIGTSTSAAQLPTQPYQSPWVAPQGQSDTLQQLWQDQAQRDLWKAQGALEERRRQSFGQ